MCLAHVSVTDMHHHHINTLAILATLALSSTACFDSDELPSDIAEEGSETSTSADEADSTDEPSASEGHTDTDTNNQIEVELLVDGKDFPDSVLSARVVELEVEIESEAPTASVEFIVDGESVATLSEGPYTHQLVLADASANGVRVLTARVTDEDANVAEDTVLLPVGVPGHGETVWDYRLGDLLVVGLAVGEGDRSLLATQSSLYTIDAAGEELDSYDFSALMHTTATTPEGGIIALGAADNTLVYHRFDPSGAPDGYHTLENAAPAPFLVTGAQFGENDRLLVTWAYECGLLPCQELLSFSHVSTLSADWWLPLERDGSSPVAQAPALEVGPEGDIYLGAAFPGDAASTHLQLQRVGQGADPIWTDETLTFSSSAFRDVVTTSTSVYVGGRLDERAAIAEYSFEGERLAVYYVDGEEVSRLAAIGDELVYAAAVQDIEGAGVSLGRLSATGESKWSVMSERAEGEQEWAWDLARDSLGHVHVLSVLSSGQARLQRVAL